MSDTISKAGAEAYEALGGIVVLIGATSVEQGGLAPGATYEFYAQGGAAVCRWDTIDAAPSDGGFTFVVGDGETKRIRNPLGNTLLNVEELDSSSAATAVLTLSRVIPD